MSCQLASACCASVDHSLAATSAISYGQAATTGTTPASSSGSLGPVARWGTTVGGSKLSWATTSRRYRQRPQDEATAGACGCSCSAFSTTTTGSGRGVGGVGGVGGVVVVVGGCGEKQSVGRNLGDVSRGKNDSWWVQPGGQWRRRREEALTTTHALTDDRFWISAFQATMVAVGTGGMAVLSAFVLREGLKRELEREAKEAMLMEEARMGRRSGRRRPRRGEEEVEEEPDDYDDDDDDNDDDVDGYGDEESGDGEAVIRDEAQTVQVRAGGRRRSRPVQRQ